MQRHIKNYLEYYGVEQDQIRCENCGLPANSIHHIIFRSKFGKKTKHLQDDISNLIALDQICHQKAHGIGGKLTKEELQEIHNNNLKND